MEYEYSNVSPTHELNHVLDGATPPSYTPSPNTPSYSYHPRRDEERLAITAREGTLTRTGSFRMKSKGSGVALQLNDQEEGVSIPSFGRNAIICGKLEFSSLEGIQCVEVELEGQLKLAIAEGGNKTKHLFRTIHTIWQKNSDQPRSCPSTLRFVVPMPNVYSEGESTRPLPPSYQIIFPGVPGLFANSIYTFSVRIKRERRLLWKRTDVLSTPMKYYPRTRAPRVILKPSLSFFSVLKIAPEEFREVLSIMKTRVGSGFAPIHCLLFIPSSCIYAMTEEIPFHIQLIAPTTSLLAFSYPHVYSGLSRTSVVAQLQTTSQPQSVSRPPIAAVPSGASIRSASTLSRSIRQNITSISTTLSRSRSGVRQLIRVFLLRQIIVEVRGQRAWRTCVLGEGKLTPSPPGHSPPRAYPYPRPEQSHSSFFHPPGTNTASRPSCSPRHSLVMQRTSSICSARGHGAYDFGYKSGACADPDADPIQTLDWDGTVRVKNPAEIQAGGFTVGNLVVKDFVVLSLEPPDPARNPLIALQHAHPIRLVTDPLEGDWTR